MLIRVLSLLLFFIYTSLAQAQLSSHLECRYLTMIEQGFLNYHVRYSTDDLKEKSNKVQAELREHLISQYLKMIDPSKIYLLDQDVSKITSVMNDVFAKTRNRDCQFLEDIKNILVHRIKERKEFVEKFLGKTYKFDKTVEFVYDPDKKVWSKTTDDANEFLKKYVHSQIANYLATDMKLPEAKKSVLKSYDRILKSSEQKDLDDLYSNYLDAYARSLDPHSSFFSNDAMKDFEIQMSLSLEGIGATLSSQDGFTVVENLVPGGAAAKSGFIEIQDKIVAVGQENKPIENVIDMDLKDVVKKIRGPKGTKVYLQILRKKGSETKRLDVTLVREKINLEDEAASIQYIDKEVDGKKKKIGVINFPSFYADSRREGRSSAADMKKIIKQAVAQKADGLVLDLSNNGGGSLDDAVKIAGLFFAEGNVVKQSSRNEAQPEIVLRDKDKTVDWAGPLVVLTSRVSASASEIVSGTLQDYKRAIIVGGDHTFGKGTVQTVVPLNDLGAMKVTIGMFFVPGGNSTQHRGVNADVVLPGIYSTDEIGEKVLDYSLPPKKIPPFLSTEAYVEDGPSAWTPIKPEWISVLKQKSKERVDKAEGFKKIEDTIAKARERGKLVKVAEALKEKNEKEKENKAKKKLSKKEKDQEYLKNPYIQEATNVLLDLIDIEKRGNISQQAKSL